MADSPGDEFVFEGLTSWTLPLEVKDVKLTPQPGTTQTEPDGVYIVLQNMSGTSSFLLRRQEAGQLAVNIFTALGRLGETQALRMLEQVFPKNPEDVPEEKTYQSPTHRFAVHDFAMRGNSENASVPTPQQASSSTVAMGDILTKLNDGDFNFGITFLDNSTGTFTWWRAGQGAGLICWRQSTELVAVSLICSGIDRAADSIALSAAINDFNTDRRVAEKLRDLRAPFLSTMFGTAQAVEKLGIAALAAGFAEAFYARLDSQQPPSHD